MLSRNAASGWFNLRWLVESSETKKTIAKIRIVFWIVTSVAGFVQAWSLRFAIYPDGNSYLDIATSYARGDFAHAINGAWSPLFSWLIVGIWRIFQPSGYWETTALHLLNFAGMLLALRCFEFFFSAFLHLVKRSTLAEEEPLLGEASWWLLGYGLFFSTSLFVLTMEPSTPDVWVCVFSYLAVGLLLRIALFSSHWGHFAALGLVLGAAYLTKSLYFPLTFVFFGCACLVGQGFRKNVPRVVLSFVIFCLVAGPFVLALSKSKHRFTYGDVGNIAAAMFLDSIPQVTFWHGEEGTGTPKHPTRLILAAPQVFEFATPVVGSYPPGYDLSYWTEGIRPHFRFRGALRILRQSAGTAFLILLIQAEFAVGLLVLTMCQQKWRDGFFTVARMWPLWLPPMVAALAYASVLLENRYVAPFLVFLWLALFAGAVSPPSAASKRVAAAVILAILFFAGIKEAKYFVSDLAEISGQRNTNWEVAQNLAKIGIQPGDRVSVIAAMGQAHWARLAGVKVVAEVPLGQDTVFWAANAPTKEKVLAAFASTGSCVAVVKDPPPSARNEGWTELGETPYYVHKLPANPLHGPDSLHCAHDQSDFQPTNK
jgi:hypothetical protein